MKNTTRVLALVLAVVMMLSLAACGSTEAPAATNAAAPEATTVAPAAPAAEGENILRFALAQDIETLDAQQNTLSSPSPSQKASPLPCCVRTTVSTPATWQRATRPKTTSTGLSRSVRTLLGPMAPPSPLMTSSTAGSRSSTATSAARSTCCSTASLAMTLSLLL